MKKQMGFDKIERKRRKWGKLQKGNEHVVVFARRIWICLRGATGCSISASVARVLACWLFQRRCCLLCVVIFCMYGFGFSEASFIYYQF